MTPGNQARRYRHVVQLQAATVTVDALGQQVKTWATVATHRAEVRALNGRELLQADRIDATLTTAVVHRFVAEGAAGRPTASHRYLLGSRVLWIVAVSDPTGESHELKAVCTEDAAP